MKIALRKLVSAGYLLVSAILVVNIVITIENIRTLDDNERLLLRCRQVQNRLERTLSTLKDAETGQRGYLLTGEAEYLKPYQRAVEGIDGNLAGLDRIITIDPRMVDSLSKLKPLIEKKLAELRDSIAVRDRQGMNAAIAIVRSNQGENTMDRIRNLVAMMLDREAKLFSERSEVMRAAVKKTIYTFSLVSILALGLLIATWRINSDHNIEIDRAADAIRLSEAWLSTTLASIGDGVIATDPQGVVRFLNGIAASLTGWPREQAVGKPLDEVFRIINESTRDSIESPVGRVICEGRIIGLANHTILVARDGSETPIDDSAAPIRDESGAITGVVLIFRDVIERKQAERERERLLTLEQAARAEAERAGRAKDYFLAVLSHELRTPLTPVLLTASALLEDPQTPDSIRSALDLIRRNVEAEARLIDDLLDVGRINRGIVHLRKCSINIHEHLKHVVDSCSIDLAKGGLACTVELESNRPIIEADPARLQQIFRNLIENALKFTPGGGSLSIRVRDDDRTDGSEAIRIDFSDTGIGIESEYLETIFAAFEQAGERSLRRRFGGLGLGLAISRAIAEAHGGSLFATSEGRDRGAIFTLILPRSKLIAPDPPTIDRPALDNHRHEDAPIDLKILVVDDDVSTLHVISKYLRQKGYDVETAANFAQAIAAANHNVFDCLISDIGLPDGDGYELMRTIRERSNTLGIALSGFGMETDVAKSLHAGFIEHITKPIDFPRLLAAIRRTASEA